MYYGRQIKFIVGFLQKTIFVVVFLYKPFIYLAMLAVIGTYENGNFKLDSEITFKNPVRVIITFLEEIDPISVNELNLSDFSFSESKKLLKNYNGSFSESLVEERRQG